MHLFIKLIERNVQKQVISLKYDVFLVTSSYARVNFPTLGTVFTSLPSVERFPAFGTCDIFSFVSSCVSVPR